MGCARWAFGDPEPDEKDPVLLLWWMHRRINRELLPPGRVVVRFDFRRTKRQRLWLVLERSDVSVCLTDPGFDTDLVVTADIGAFYRIWLGRITLGEALHDGLVEIDGTPVLLRAFPRWLQWSHLAGAVHAAMTNRPQAITPSASPPPEGRRRGRRETERGARHDSYTAQPVICRSSSPSSRCPAPGAVLS